MATVETDLPGTYPGVGRTRRDGLTDRQAEILDLARTYYDAAGEGCTVAYIARHLGIFHEAVRGHVAALYRKGWLASSGSPVIPLRASVIPFPAER